MISLVQASVQDNCRPMFRGCHGVEYEYEIIDTNENGNTSIASSLVYGKKRFFKLRSQAKFSVTDQLYFRPLAFAFFNLMIMQTFLGMMQFTNKFHKMFYWPWKKG